MALLLLGSAAAAETTGRITGVVSDPSGAEMAGAMVTIVNNATGITWTARTDVRGVYAFPVLPVGNYDLNIDATGFSPYRQIGIVINVNSFLTADVTMQVGRRTEDLKVEDNFDVALHKSMKLTESKMLELRLETFNTFNHAQLYPNGSVDGNTSSPTFGRVLKATPARIGQLALKLTF